MLTSPYSRPEFDPYGSNDVLSDDSGHWKAPLATAPVTGRLQIPGSKSLTNRELVLAALADGPSTIKRPLHSRDSRLMIEALKSLGSEILEVPEKVLSALIGRSPPVNSLVPQPLIAVLPALSCASCLLSLL